MAYDYFSVNVFGTEHDIILENIFAKQKQYEFFKLRLLFVDAVYQRKQLENEYQSKKAVFIATQLQKTPNLPKWRIKNQFMMSDVYKQYQKEVAKMNWTINRLKAVMKASSIV